jgi:hypothetical protein
MEIGVSAYNMIKCLECGFEADRLQWTHFKYNCTGKFNNGKDYQISYPGAKVVSKNLAKKTAVTLKNLISKYGLVNGEIRWNEYRKKQAETNTFKYKEKKYGWTRDQFNEYNSSRAQTLEKMIERHGEDTGIKKWQTYCDRQAYTNTKKYFIEKHGIDSGTKKYIQICKKKSEPHNPELLAKKLNITNDAAVDIILSRSKSEFRYSNLEKEFIHTIEKNVGVLDHTSLRKPFGKWSSYLKTYVVYDIKHKNCIIEFNGDYWHANPKIYKDTAMIRGINAIDIRNRDILKLRTVEDLGFRTLVIWESEYRSDKENIIKKVIKWISQEQK